MRRLGSANDAEDVAFLHDEKVLTVQSHLGTKLAEQDAITSLEVERRKHAILGFGARARGDDLALLRLLLYGIGHDDAARGLRGSDDAAIEHRSEEHTSELQSLMRISYAVFCLKK